MTTSFDSNEMASRFVQLSNLHLGGRVEYATPQQTHTVTISTKALLERYNQIVGEPSSEGTGIPEFYQPSSERRSRTTELVRQGTELIGQTIRR